MTRQALLSALTVTCGLLVLQGCKSDTAKDAKIRPVLVLEYGMAPRFPLHYTIQDGSMTTSTMELTTSSMTTTTSAGEEFTEAPGLRFVVSSGPAIKLPNGNVRLEVRIVEAEATMPVVEVWDLSGDLVLEGACPQAVENGRARLDTALVTVGSAFGRRDRPLLAAVRTQPATIQPTTRMTTAPTRSRP